jgi:hypothetical protein
MRTNQLQVGGEYFYRKFGGMTLTYEGRVHRRAVSPKRRLNEVAASDREAVADEDIARTQGETR